MIAIAVAVLLSVAATAAVAAWLHRRASRRTATELATIRSELARRLSELFTLQELAYLLSESLQLDRIVTQVAKYVTRFLHVDGSAVALTGDAGGPIRIVAAEGILSPATARQLSEREAGLIGTAIGLEKLQVGDAGDAGDTLQIAGVDVQRAAAAPLRAHGVTVGALAVVNRAGHPFSDEDLRLLSTVATHAAIVLANARFFDLIRAGKEQWETTFDALTEGIAVVDANGRIRRANRAMAELLQRPIPALIGVDLAEALLGQTPEMAKFFAVQTGAVHTGITIESQPLGRIVRITAASLTGPESEGWVVALVEDVTEQKAMETQLIQNEKMVAVGQLVSGVAHELNNPLTSIHGLSEFLLEQAATPDREREHLKVIQEQAERASRIVRNLLTFARKGPAGMGDVDLNDIVQRTVQLMGYELKLREIQLETKLAPELPPVRGDRYELQQVVLNLLTNAVHAVTDNPEDRPRRILLNSELAGGQVVVRVADSGTGVAPEHAAQLFSPFFTTKEAGHGTGLGLSISFGIIERHGGKLSVERGGIGGAVFVIAIPVAREGSASEASSQPSLTAEGAKVLDLAEGALPQRVLLVDDDPAVRRTIRALFSRDGQKVETPTNAADAVRQLETGTFDLIIADARVAVSAGETFADVLLSRWPALRSRTILITADVRPETHQWLKALGCSYFQKPFRIGELKEAAARIAALGAPGG